MFWQALLAAFLQLGFIQLSTSSHASIFQIPAWNFTLSCILSNKTSHSSLPTGVPKTIYSMSEDQGLNLMMIYLTHANSAELEAKEDDFCCISSETDVTCSSPKNDTELKPFLSNMTDLKWNMWCWTRGDMEAVICNLKASDEKSQVNSEHRANLFYVLSNFSFGESSIISQKDNILATSCNCSAHEICECLIPSVKPEQTYTVWVEIKTGVSSPLMSVKPLDIVKPNPPFNLHMEITEKGELKLCWSNPAPVPYELQYEVRHLVNSTENAWQIVRETSVTIDNKQLDSSHLVQVRCRRLHGPGFWSDWSSLYDLNSEGQVFLKQINDLQPKVKSLESNLGVQEEQIKDLNGKLLIWNQRIMKLETLQPTMVKDMTSLRDKMETFDNYTKFIT
ncbi:leptin receptor [Microcaecilia unicolor]|uniref:Leptin receptor-like n=1 Tax=Microcaecilia unicolor TaxID=1415580 RepID=A0A6P7Y996_9AMPH|nr:leptin receptor-like [Microcaecilia unicolor]